VADPDAVSGIFLNSESGWKKIQIRDKDCGSTKLPCTLIILHLGFQSTGAAIRELYNRPDMESAYGKKKETGSHGYE
jgi:hypothetical protein